MGGFTLILLGVALAAAVPTVSAGSFQPMGLMMMHRAARSAGIPHKNPKHMTDDELFNVFYKDPSYLLKPEEANPPDEGDDEWDHEDDEEGEHLDGEEASDEHDLNGTGRALVRVGDDDEYYDDDDDYLDDYDYGTGRSIGSVGKQVIKQIGKVGLSMLKKGLKFLKGVFYKFGGKRLIKKAKEYLKNAFSIDPIDCKDAMCKSCAVFTLPFKIKKFSACANMGFKRNRGKTNFTVSFNVEKSVLFDKDFEVGDLANCHEFDKDPESDEYRPSGFAAVIGKVCLQGFEFKVESKKKGQTQRKGKFCIALVFKRWGTGFRFCVERKEKKKGKEEKGENGKKGGKQQPKKPDPNNEVQRSRGKIVKTNADGKKLVWKVTFKKIAAGEQDNQIVGDKPLFKGESKVRKEEAEKALGNQ